MQKLNFKYMRAKNFLCFEDIEIDFSKYGKIVLIQGENHDVIENGKIANNGIGKSSIADIPIYALFGKTTKDLNHGDVINKKTGEKLECEFRWDEYRIVRKREPNSLKLWHSPEGKWDKTTEITKGTMSATQDLIESIISLNYKTFTNLYLFSDSNTNCFLECDTPTKREIVENLLSLEKYRNYAEITSELSKQAKEIVRNLTREYENLLVETEKQQENLKNIEQQEQKWKKVKLEELRGILLNIKNKQDQLESSEQGSALIRYKEAQEQIVYLKESIPINELKKEKLSIIIKEANEKLSELRNNHYKLIDELSGPSLAERQSQQTIDKNKSFISSWDDKIGDSCPYCYNDIDEAKIQPVISKAKKTILEHEKIISDAIVAKNTVIEKIEKNASIRVKIENGINDANDKLNSINNTIKEIYEELRVLSQIKPPKTDVDSVILQESIEELKKQAIAKEEEIENSPYKELKNKTELAILEKEKETLNKKQEADNAEKTLPYYEFWHKGFGDKGIRKYIIDRIIPSLNNRIAYWLQILIDNKIKLEFNSELEASIDKFPFYGKKYVYYSSSGGQRRRLNLAVSQAFAYILALNIGFCPNTVFLDEVSINIDEIGIDGVYRMICELSKEKQVFVIDHNPILLQMLEGSDSIDLIMKDQVTKIHKFGK